MEISKLLIKSILIFVISVVDISGNPLGWNLINSRLYYFSGNTEMRLDEARDECDRRGAYLIKIEGPDENRIIAHNISEKIILDMRRNGNDWEWKDGAEVVYSNWESPYDITDPDAPPLGTYAIMKANGEWRDEHERPDERFICEKADPCRESNSPTCENGGSCAYSTGRYGYECVCTPGWTGRHCDYDIDECVSSPCANEGLCFNLQSRFECQCDIHWEGETCEIDVNECEDNPCQHHAVCINHPGSFQCDCSIGWEGVLCDIDVNECASSPCQNNGTCTDALNGFNCRCNRNWTGETCNTALEIISEVSSTETKGSVTGLYVAIGLLAGFFMIALTWAIAVTMYACRIQMQPSDSSTPRVTDLEKQTTQQTSTYDVLHMYSNTE